ncbi:MAG: Maf family protein [Bacteroidota bacterium]|nr:Maf family protein [Bacteroidota bacterium]
MINTKLPIFLASQSPRRKKLLEQINLKFKVVVVNTAERIKKGEMPVDTCKRIALEKIEAAKNIIPNGLIITADTIVVIDNKILGKPKNKKDAFRILKMLSGRTHQVYTGFSLFNSETGKTITGFERTIVKFRDLEEDEILNYIESGSPMDKAGAYGIQDDYGAVFVEKITGCYYNVVGLPLAKIYKNLLRII